jgi:hypothetical protein
VKEKGRAKINGRKDNEKTYETGEGGDTGKTQIPNP